MRWLVLALLQLRLALGHRWAAALYLQGSLPAALLGSLWLLAGWKRLQELRRQQAMAKRRPTAGAKGGPPTDAPPVAVILPARGHRPETEANWAAALSLEYAGPLDFLFVVESAADPAHAVATRLAAAAPSHGPRRAGRVVLAGHAASVSQKIHNLLAGIAAAVPSAAFILCLDDDVRPHPGALAALVADMVAAPELRVATGYPFDVPARGAGVLAYAALAYHLPLVIAFSLAPRTHFVWGGCMLLRGEDVRGDDRLGFLAAWAAGGYSDDLTLAARCTELGLEVYCPAYAIFPQAVDAEVSGRRYWNYLRRQLVVLDTYVSPHNRRTNHILAAAHCYLSWALVAPAGLLAARGAVAVAAGAVWAWGAWCGGFGGSRMAEDTLDAAWQAAGFDWGAPGDAAAAGFAGLAAYTAAALWWMTGVVCALLETLNPRDLGPGAALAGRFHWPRLWAGFLASNAAIPLCMAYTFATRHIEWAGVRYTRRRGRVVAVEHAAPPAPPALPPRARRRSSRLAATTGRPTVAHG